MGHVRSKPEKPVMMAPLRTSPVVPPPAPRLPPFLAEAISSKSVRGTASHQFDKAFQVFISSDAGNANGVGRNISSSGMFIETREPCSIGSEVRVTFSAESIGTELTAVGEVRFQCFLNYSSGRGKNEGLRGMGIRFLRFEEVPSGTLRLPPTRQ